MEKVRLRNLSSHQALDGPLYSNKGVLLLAEGHVFTTDMLGSLLRSGEEHAYLGEWDSGQVARLESVKPVADYRMVAEKMSEGLQDAVERSLKSAEDLDAKPEGTPFEESIDDAHQAKRTDRRFREWEAVARKGSALVESVVEGRIESERVAEATQEVVGKVMDALAADRSLLANLTNFKDTNKYLYTHSLNTSVLSISIATSLGHDLTQVRDIGVAALLQDIAMGMVPPKTLNARRSLNAAEFLDVQRHAMHVLFLINKMRGLPFETRYVAYQCHERCNGTGYPKRRGKAAVHRFAKIVAVADVFDALTTDRPWRKAYHPYRAMEFIIVQTSKGAFDREIVRGLLHSVSLYPVGILVELTSGEVARVVHSNGAAIDRPVLSVLFDADGTSRSSPKTVDLLQEDGLSVKTMIDKKMSIDLYAGF